MEGLGTNDSDLIRIIVSRSEVSGLVTFCVLLWQGVDIDTVSRQTVGQVLTLTVSRQTVGQVLTLTQSLDKQLDRC